MGVELEGPGTARGLTDGRGRGRCEPVDPDPEPNSSFPNPAISLDLAAAADDDDADDPSNPTPKFKPALDLDNDLYSLYFAAIANEPQRRPKKSKHQRSFPHKQPSHLLPPEREIKKRRTSLLTHLRSSFDIFSPWITSPFGSKRSFPRLDLGSNEGEFVGHAGVGGG